jgi:hypothetical protein
LTPCNIANEPKNNKADEIREGFHKFLCLIIFTKVYLISDSANFWIKFSDFFLTTKKPGKRTIKKKALKRADIRTKGQKGKQFEEKDDLIL